MPIKQYFILLSFAIQIPLVIMQIHDIPLHERGEKERALERGYQLTNLLPVCFYVHI